MPQENTNQLAMLDALARIAPDLALVDGAPPLDEADFAALIEGHEQAGKRIAPYLRLLAYEPGEEIVRRGDWGGDRFYFVVEGFVEVFRRRGTVKVGEVDTGSEFGGMSVLANMPRSATVRAPQGQAVTVLEVQRPALRLLRKVPQFAALMGKAYRRNMRAVLLQELAVAVRLEAEALKRLATISQYRVYERHHQLFRQGEPIKRLYIIRSGWVQLFAGVGEHYLGAGYCLGMAGLKGEHIWLQDCQAQSRVELLEISLSLLRETPELARKVSKALERLASPRLLTQEHQPPAVVKAQRVAIETGVAESANLLVIDARTCTRCGNCSLTCHQLHGQGRLARRGFALERPVSLKHKAPLQTLHVPAACQHCRQPECLAGCPTSAIKQLANGRVEIDEARCIGCGDCVALCPYDALSLIPREAGEWEGAPAEQRWFQGWLSWKPPALPASVNPARELVAAKCDLCASAPFNVADSQPQLYGCEENCPTGALRRVEPRRQFAELRAITGAAFQTEETAAQPDAWRADRGQRWLHWLGLGLVWLTAALLGSETSSDLAGRNWHWLTGGGGAVCLLGVLAYGWRKRQRRRRVGALRYWLLAHNYLGLTAALFFVWHCRAGFGNPLTMVLAVLAALLLLTGLGGWLINLLAPRVLTALEPQPWLREDLLQRRAELRQQGMETLGQMTAATRELLERRVVRRLCSPGFLLKQLWRRPPLEQVIATAQERYQAFASNLAERERVMLTELVTLAVTAGRVDALLFLHWLLRCWLPPHVFLAVLFLVTLVLHVLQALYFTAR